MSVFDEKIPTAPQQTNPIAVFLDQLKKVQAQQQGARQTMPTMRLPGQVGGAPPSLASPLPNVGGGQPLATTAPMGAPAAGPAIPHQAPTPGGMQTGMEFSTKEGRNGAIVQGAIANITQAVAAAKNEKQEHVKRQAENYMSQIMAAQAAGDKQTLDLLLKDPKVIKTLEKGLDYIMPKTPGEPPPPEAQGLHAAMTKAQQKQAKQQQANSPLPSPNTPGGVAIPQQSQATQDEAQTQAAIAKARKEALLGNPQLMQMMALGIPPVEVMKMDKEQIKTSLEISRDLTQMEMDLKKSIIESGAKVKVGKMSADSRMAMVGMYKEYHKGMLDLQKARATGKAQDYIKVQMQTLSSQINARNTAANVAEKNGDKDVAEKLRAEATDLQKKYQEASDAADTSMDEILKQMLNGEPKIDVPDPKQE